MPFNFSSPEYLSHHRRRKNRASPVSRASPAHMNSFLVQCVPRNHSIVVKRTLLWFWEFKLASKTHNNTMCTEDNR